LRDEPDFEDFYAAVFDQLVGQLFLVTGNLQDAEDAVQEALTRAALRWPGCAATGPPRPGCGGWP
jgi:RNA polymerase sigma-70 factor, ECF subfamily